VGTIINDDDKCECGAYYQTNGYCCEGHPRTKKKMDWRRWFALWKFRLDNAVSFLVFANFILLSITASAPIQDFLLARLGWQFEMYSVVGVLVVSIVVCAFAFGLILDKVFHYTQNTMTIQNQRNPELSEILSNTRKILKKQGDFLNKRLLQHKICFESAFIEHMTPKQQAELMEIIDTCSQIDDGDD
jgi:hypothetical protein